MKNRVNNDYTIKPSKGSAYRSESSGVDLVKSVFERFNSNKHIHKYNVQIDPENLKKRDKDLDCDGFIIFSFSNNGYREVRVYCQIKSWNDSTLTFSVKDSFVRNLSINGVDSNLVIWLKPMVKEQKILYKLLTVKEYNELLSSKNPKIVLDNDCCFTYDFASVLDFFKSWHRLWVKQYNINDELLAQKLQKFQFDGSVDKIKPVSITSPITDKGIGESERVYEIDLELRSLRKESTKSESLYTIFEENPTLLSRMFQIATSKFNEKAELIYNLIIIDDLKENLKIKVTQDWLNAKNDFLIFVLNTNIESSDIIDYVWEIALSGNERSKSLAFLIFTKKKAIPKIDNVVIDSLLSLDSINSGFFFSLFEFAEKSTNLDFSIRLYLKAIKKFGLPNLGYSRLDYSLKEFFKNALEKTGKRNNKIEKILVKSFLVWAEESEHNQIGGKYINVLISSWFPSRYISFEENRAESNYYQFLKQYCHILSESELLRFFDSILSGSEIHESLIFFIYRYVNSKNISYSRVFDIVDEIKSEGGVYEQYADYWMESSSTTKMGYSTKEEIIESWVEQDKKYRSNYKKWNLDDWLEYFSKKFEISDKFDLSAVVSDTLTDKDILDLVSKVIDKSDVLSQEKNVILEFLFSYVNRKDAVDGNYLIKLVSLLPLDIDLVYGYLAHNVLQIVSSIDKKTIISNLGQVLPIVDYFYENDILLTIKEDAKVVLDKESHISVSDILNTKIGLFLDILILRILPHADDDQVKKTENTIQNLVNLDLKLLNESILYYLSKCDRKLIEKLSNRFVDDLLKHFSKKLGDVGMLKVFIMLASRSKKHYRKYCNLIFNKIIETLDRFGSESVKELNYEIEFILNQFIYKGHCSSVIFNYLRNKPFNKVQEIMLSYLIRLGEDYRRFLLKKDKRQCKRFETVYNLLLDNYIKHLDEGDSEKLDKIYIDSFFYKFETDYKKKSQFMDFLNYWFNNGILEKILYLTRYNYHNIFDTPYLDNNILAQSKKYRQLILRFIFLLTSNIDHDKNDVTFGVKIVEPVIFIVEKDGLYNNKLVLDILNNLLKSKPLSKSILDLNRIINENQ